MTDIARALLSRIGVGEDSTPELKTVAFSGKRLDPRQKSVADELAAFANTRGGTLVLGVDDKTRTVLGIDREKLERVEQLVVNAAQTLVDPPLPLVMRRLELPGEDGTFRAVLAVEVTRSLYVHKSPG